jgi:hypothetical protein
MSSELPEAFAIFDPDNYQFGRKIDRWLFLFCLQPVSVPFSICEINNFFDM